MTNDDLSLEDIKDLVGRVLDDRYSLDKFIDRGGFGAVYRGTNTRFGTPVAIKIGLSSREFMKEARLMNEVQHPHIVQVIDYGSDQGLAFLIMEYLHGEELEQLFRRQGCRLTQDQLHKFVREVGDALSFAHANQLIHRDLKPRNIILKQPMAKAGVAVASSKFVLFDFGIAAKINSKGTLANHTQNGAGTVEYMAPELLGRTPQATPQSDIYAFGVMLYQLITGQVPFPQADASHMALGQCVYAIGREQPRRFSEVDPNRTYSPGIEELVLQCLEKDPARRPQTIAEVCQRFFEVVKSELDTTGGDSDTTPDSEPLPDNPDDLVGRVINGRYVIESFIGRGGYGFVFKGQDNKLTQTVAIKVGPSSREFMKEARNAASVKHDNIVMVNDYGFDGGLAYLIMEYLQGEDLESLFQREGRLLSKYHLRKLVDEVGGALEFAHGEHLIHRDLKPRNIIFKSRAGKSATQPGNNRFVLLDFGIAARLNVDFSHQSESTKAAGTVEYMAPELLSDSPEVTPRSDLYAFGVILYQMMTGRVPFPQAGSPRSSCIAAIRSKRPPRFRDVEPNREYYPDEMEELVFQCLEKDPARRPQSVAEVCQRFFEIHDLLFPPTPESLANSVRSANTLKSGRIRNSASGSLQDSRLAARMDNSTSRNQLYNTISPFQQDLGETEFSTPHIPQVTMQPPEQVRLRLTLYIGAILGIFALSGALMVPWLFPRAGADTPVPPSEEVLLLREDGSKLDEGSTLTLIAGQSQRLTFRIDHLRDDVLFEASPPAEPRQTTVAISDPAVPAKSKEIYVSVPDVNARIDQPLEIELQAKQKDGTLLLKRSFLLKIERPKVWLPDDLAELGFQEAPDSWLCSLKEEQQVFASILVRDVGSSQIRFRLVPGRFVQELTYVKTMYSMESLVTNKAFGLFVSDVGSALVEVKSRKPEERTWESEDPTLPVTNIYGLEAQQFASWLGGHDYGRLPLAEEWELIAGYWDFIQLCEAEPDADPKSFDTRPLNPLPILNAKVLFASSPEHGRFEGWNAPVIENCSPYGCKFSEVKNNMRISEMTRSVRGENLEKADLQKILQRERLNPDAAVLKQFPFIILRGPDAESNEISWLDSEGSRVKSVVDLENGMPLFKIAPPSKATKRPDVGFRVILTTKK